jgi:Fe-S-cluster-containing dehydrogenase component
VALELGLVLHGARGDDIPTNWIEALVEDLRQAGQRALVVAGPHQPESVHRLACAMNATLGAVGTTVTYAEPPDATPAAGGLPELVGALRAAEVDTLLLLDVNPVYEAPGDLGFAGALGKAGTTIHLGAYRDETARLCSWHVPMAHPLESWGDLRATDGTAGILQPTIAPIYGGRTACELIDALDGRAPRTARALVQAHWRGLLPEHGFEEAWQNALRLGVVANTARHARPVSLRAHWQAGLTEPASPTAGLELLFRPDPTVRDGRFANNAWLQELPKPLTKLVWENAVLIAPDTARRLGVEDGDLVRIRHDGRTLLAPGWRLPGQARDSLTLPLGYGRRHAGRVGSGIGFDANVLRTAAEPWVGLGATVEAAGSRVDLVSTQHHQSMIGRDLARTETLAACRQASQASSEQHPREEALPSLYPGWDRTDHAWAMSIDLDACIGCGACTIACQAENNIPVVGKEQVQRGREMHWIRVDRYFAGEPQAPRILFQPVPCMHCEDAPCEIVCPVGATLHDSEGLNLQVYNRCIGTRFCSNNCPYKVRRFNFLQFSVEDSPALDARANPQVTVRQRGVMEKCTYCLQRINAARRDAEQEDRSMRDGDVVTACHGACPTRAIVFGDLTDPESRVSRAKASPRDYSLLRELGTRPRTTYLVRLRNPKPKLGGGEP